MPIGEMSGSRSSPVELRNPESESTEDSQEISSGQRNPPAPAAAKRANPLINHKGKLAIGAAAMLGLAVFYKWRDSKLAKEDPEEYARLRRLKAAVGTDESKPKKER